jgi:hypothetical protein
LQINNAGIEEGGNCRRITIQPHYGGPVSQEIFTDRACDNNQDVYLLRVKKKNEMSETCKARNLEVEIKSPKPPPVQPPAKLRRKLSLTPEVTESNAQPKADNENVKKNNK